MASKGSDTYEKTRLIRGHHIYKFVWILFIGKELVVEAEDGSEHDENAITVMNDGCVVRHILRCISQVSWFFLKRGGCILCCVTGKRKLGVGLEVTPSAGTQRLFESRRLLPTCMWLNLDPAYKRDRRLFEGGFYSRIYGIQKRLRHPLEQVGVHVQARFHHAAAASE